MAASGPDRLILVPSSGIGRGVPEAVTVALTTSFGLAVSIDQRSFELPTDASARSGSQLMVCKALEQLRKRFERVSPLVLAIVSCDITTPIMQYVLGEAELGGRYGVISTARLGSRDVPERAAKVAAHEVGHLFDLAHCDQASCAMFPVVDLLELDARSTGLCRYCTSDLDYRRSLKVY